MARRRRRRSRNNSFLPIILRVVAILIIAFVCYRVMQGRGSLMTADVDGQTNAETSGDLEFQTPVVETKTNLVASSGTTADTPARPWSFWNYLGYGNEPEVKVVTPPVVTVATDQRAREVLATKQSTLSTQPPPSTASQAFAQKRPVTSAAAFRKPDSAGRLNSTAQTKTPSDGLSAAQIFSGMQTAYGQLQNYSDNGKITFSYRNRGTLTQEESDFSTTWNAAAGKYAGKIFKSELVCDGKNLSCFIYDIDTENFGGQQLVIPVERGQTGPPIARLLNDPFAKDFLAGAEDFTLNPPSKGFDQYVLPPALALLSGQISSPWVAKGVTTTRLADEKVDGADCFQIQSVPANTSTTLGGAAINKTSNAATLWIDKKSGLVRKIQYPSSLFVSEILETPTITDLQLFATFAGQSSGPIVDQSQFIVKPARNAKPVSRFISLPASLPADSIGEVARQIQFIDRNGEKFTSDDLRNKITTLAWIGAEIDLALVDQLAAFKKSYPEEFAFNVAYLPDMAQDDGSGVPRPIDTLRAKERLGVPFLFDSGRALTDMQVKALPTLLVLDRAGKVQFSQNMSDEDWQQNLKAALSQVAANKDLAGDMIADYQKHRSVYERDLERFDASALLGVAPAATVKVADRVLKRQRDQKVELTPNLKWQQDDFAKPGNVMVLPRGQFRSASLAIFDGFQTLKFLNSAGEVLGKKTLEIPQDQAVSVLRFNPAGRGTYAAFARMGKQVHFFDQSFELIRSFPALEQTHSGIHDCHADPQNAGQFLVSFSDNHGVYQFDALTGKPNQIAESVISDMAAISSGGSPVLAVGNNQLVDMKSWKPITSDPKQQYHRLLSAGGGTTRFCATVRSGPNIWSAVGLSDQLKRLWSVDLQSQLQQNEVEPLAVARTASGDTFWAVVDDGDTVCLISDSGAWLGDFKANSEVHGLAIETSGDQVDLIVATEQDVTNWALNYDARR